MELNSHHLLLLLLANNYDVLSRAKSKLEEIKVDSVLSGEFVTPKAGAVTILCFFLVFPFNCGVEFFFLNVCDFFPP